MLPKILRKVFKSILALHLFLWITINSLYFPKVFFLNPLFEAKLSQPDIQDDPAVYFLICITVCLFDFTRASARVQETLLFPCQLWYIVGNFWLVLAGFSSFLVFLLHLQQNVCFNFTRAVTRVQETIPFPACQLWQMWQNKKPSNGLLWIFEVFRNRYI